MLDDDDFTIPIAAPAKQNIFITARVNDHAIGGGHDRRAERNANVDAIVQQQSIVVVKSVWVKIIDQQDAGPRRQRLAQYKMGVGVARRSRPNKVAERRTIVGRPLRCGIGAGPVDLLRCRLNGQGWQRSRNGCFSFNGRSGRVEAGSFHHRRWHGEGGGG